MHKPAFSLCLIAQLLGAIIPLSGSAGQPAPPALEGTQLEIQLDITSLVGDMADPPATAVDDDKPDYYLLVCPKSPGSGDLGDGEQNFAQTPESLSVSPNTTYSWGPKRFACVGFSKTSLVLDLGLFENDHNFRSDTNNPVGDRYENIHLPMSKGQKPEIAGDYMKGEIHLRPASSAGGRWDFQGEQVFEGKTNKVKVQVRARYTRYVGFSEALREQIQSLPASIRNVPKHTLSAADAFDSSTGVQIGERQVSLEEVPTLFTPLDGVDPKCHSPLTLYPDENRPWLFYYSSKISETRMIEGRDYVFHFSSPGPTNNEMTVKGKTGLFLAVEKAISHQNPEGARQVVVEEREGMELIGLYSLEGLKDAGQAKRAQACILEASGLPPLSEIPLGSIDIKTRITYPDAARGLSLPVTVTLGSRDSITTAVLSFPDGDICEKNLNAANWKEVAFEFAPSIASDALDERREITTRYMTLRPKSFDDADRPVAQLTLADLGSLSVECLEKGPLGETSSTLPKSEVKMGCVAPSSASPRQLYGPDDNELKKIALMAVWHGRDMEVVKKSHQLVSGKPRLFGEKITVQINSPTKTHVRFRLRRASTGEELTTEGWNLDKNLLQRTGLKEGGLFPLDTLKTEYSTQSRSLDLYPPKSEYGYAPAPIPAEKISELDDFCGVQQDIDLETAKRKVTLNASAFRDFPVPLTVFMKAGERHELRFEPDFDSPYFVCIGTSGALEKPMSSVIEVGLADIDYIKPRGMNGIGTTYLSADNYRGLLKAIDTMEAGDWLAFLNKGKGLDVIRTGLGKAVNVVDLQYEFKAESGGILTEKLDVNGDASWVFGSSLVEESVLVGLGDGSVKGSVSFGPSEKYPLVGPYPVYFLGNTDQIKSNDFTIELAVIRISSGSLDWNGLRVPLARALAKGIEKGKNRHDCKIRLWTTNWREGAVRCDLLGQFPVSFQRADLQDFLFEEMKKLLATAPDDQYDKRTVNCELMKSIVERLDEAVTGDGVHVLGLVRVTGEKETDCDTTTSIVCRRFVGLKYLSAPVLDVHDTSRTEFMDFFTDLYSK